MLSTSIQCTHLHRWGYVDVVNGMALMKFDPSRPRNGIGFDPSRPRNGTGLNDGFDPSLPPPADIDLDWIVSGLCRVSLDTSLLSWVCAYNALAGGDYPLLSNLTFQRLSPGCSPAMLRRSPADGMSS